MFVMIGNQYLQYIYRQLPKSTVRDHAVIVVSPAGEAKNVGDVVFHETEEEFKASKHRESYKVSLVGGNVTVHGY